MSQKRAKRKRRLEHEKLKDQAEILYTASLLESAGTGKLDLIAKAIQKVEKISCPERTTYFKEAIAVAEELGVPVDFIGLGEGIEDLQRFDAKQFAEALCNEG